MTDVTVTADDIKRGVPWNAQERALALALARAMGVEPKKACVGPWGAVVLYPSAAHWYDISAAAQEFIRASDAGEKLPAPPITFHFQRAETTRRTSERP